MQYMLPSRNRLDGTDWSLTVLATAIPSRIAERTQRNRIDPPPSTTVTGC